MPEKFDFLDTPKTNFFTKVKPYRLYLTVLLFITSFLILYTFKIHLLSLNTWISSLIVSFILTSFTYLILFVTRKYYDVKHILNNSRTLLHQGLEKNPSSIMITDVKGRIVYVNQAFEDLSNYSFEEVYQKNPNFLKSGQLPESNFKDLWSTILSGESWSGEFHNRRKDGSFYWTESKLSSVVDQKGDIVYFLAIQNDITDKKEKLEKTSQLAITDSLTGVLNRNVMKRENQNYFLSRFDTDLYCILLLDIDYFKKINDTYGHDIGDLVLKEVASLFKQNIREDDVLIRYGGEEFLIVLSHDNLVRATVFAERIRELIEDYEFVFDNTIINLTLSIGLSQRQNYNDSIEDIIKRADIALYKAKNSGRNQTQLAD